MAYDNELYDIVDLIDIFNGQSNKNLRLFLIDRYLNNMNKKFKENKIFNKILKKRINIGLENDSNKISIINDSFLSDESSLSEDIDLYKPQSEIKEDLEKFEFSKIDTKKNTNSSYFQTYSEIDENNCKNPFEIKRTGSTLMKITNEKLDTHKKFNFKTNSQIIDKKSISNFKHISKSKCSTKKANVEIFDQKTIFYTKKNEKVIPVNELNNKFLTKSLTNMKKFYYLKNFE